VERRPFAGFANEMVSYSFGVEILRRVRRLPGDVRKAENLPAGFGGFWLRLMILSAPHSAAILRRPLRVGSEKFGLTGGRRGPASSRGGRTALPPPVQ
jgi:hypothetical protein